MLKKYLNIVFMRILTYLKDFLKKRTASRKNDFMCSQTLSITSQRNIHKSLLFPKALEARGNIVQKAVPLEAYLICHCKQSLFDNDNKSINSRLQPQIARTQNNLVFLILNVAIINSSHL